MLPHTHALFAFVLGYVGLQADLLQWPYVFLAVFISLIVDIDHYVMYAIKTKNFSFVKFWNYCITELDFDLRTVVHRWPGVFVVFAIVVLLFFVDYSTSLAVFIGYYSHLLLDLPPIEQTKALTFTLGSFQLRLFYWEVILDIFLLILLFLF